MSCTTFRNIWPKISVACLTNFLTSGTLGHWKNLKPNLKSFYDFDRSLDVSFVYNSCIIL